MLDVSEVDSVWHTCAMETGHVPPTARDIELTDSVRFAVDGAAVRENPDAEGEYVRLWWQIRLKHRPKVSLTDLAHEASKDLDPLFTLEEGDDAVYFDHPELSRKLELRLRLQQEAQS